VDGGSADSGRFPTNVYRRDPSKLEVVVTEKQIPDPNGIPFSPDRAAKAQGMVLGKFRVGTHLGIRYPVAVWVITDVARPHGFGRK
jgi:hypothetical protein